MARKPLFERLPIMTRELDRAQPGPDGRGLLERYLGVVDDSFDRALETAKGLFALRDVERIPDRYLRLLAALVGHDWREDKSRFWNRARIQHAIRRHSYRGTLDRLGDVIREAGGESRSVTDQASRVMVLSRNGRLSEDDCRIEAADYWHAGAFLLVIPDAADLEELRRGLADQTAAGEVWFLRIGSARAAVFEAAWTLRSTGLLRSTNATEFAVGQGAADDDLWISGAASGVMVSLAWQRGSGTAGGSITMDSNITIDREDITLAMGAGDSPLPESLAVTQQGATIT